MNVARILATKGKNVITIRPEQPVRAAIALLAKHNIGALVVADED
jgi:CBS domain-containing protein